LKHKNKRIWTKRAVVYFIILIILMNMLFVNKNMWNLNINKHIKHQIKTDFNSNILQTFSSIVNYSNLLDGIITESEFRNNIPINQNISLNLNNSAALFGMEINITDINETKDYITNNEFLSNIESWNFTNESDVNFYWANEHNNKEGIAVLNITGLETPHLYSKYNSSGDYYEIFKTLGNWDFKNLTEPDIKYNGGLTQSPDLNSSYALYLQWTHHIINGTEGNRSGIMYSNFTYNGTENILDVELSFDYNLGIQAAEWNTNTEGDVNLSVYLIIPNGTEYKVGNWSINLHANASTGDSEIASGFWPRKIFKLSDLGNLIREKGNYTIKFKSDHYHYLDDSANMISYSKVDNVKLIVTYSYKEFMKGSNISIYQDLIFDRQPLDYSLLNITYSISKPHIILNNSGAEIFIRVNNRTLASKKINQTNPDNWYTELYSLNPEDLRNLTNSTIKVQIGLNFTDEAVIFYPNNSWCLFIDSVSLNIKARPKPSQINLKLLFSSINRTYYPIDLGFGQGIIKIENNTIWWIGDYEDYSPLSNELPQIRRLIFNADSFNTTLNYELIKYEYSWRDVIFNEINYIKEKLVFYLNYCSNSIGRYDFPYHLLKDLMDIINKSAKGDFNEAYKYASLISQQFPFLLKSLVDELDGSFYNLCNSYNLINNKYFQGNPILSTMTLGQYNSAQQIFEEIWSLFEYFSKYNFAPSIIGPYYQSLYNTYISSVDSRLNDIKNLLINMNFSSEQLNQFNLSSLYYSLQNVKKSIELVAENMDMFFNVDPDNFLLNWHSIDSNSIIDSLNMISGIYLGDIPYLTELAINLFNNSFSEYWKHIDILELIYPQPTTLDEEEISKIFWNLPFIALGRSLFGIYGNFDVYKDNSNFKKLDIPVSARDIVYFLLIKILIEDFIIRKNAPLCLEYVYKPIQYAMEKIIGNTTQQIEYNSTNYIASYSFSTPKSVAINLKNPISKISIHNLGNDTTVKIKQYYYIPTTHGNKLIETQTYIHPNNLLRNESIKIDIPLIPPDNIFILNILSQIYGIKNSSFQYYLLQRVFFGNKIIAEYSTPLLYIYETSLKGQSIVNIADNLKNSMLFHSNFIQFDANNYNTLINISSIINSFNINFEQVKTQLISIILRRNDTFSNFHGNFFVNLTIKDRKFYWNSSNSLFFNNFSSIDVSINPYSGIVVINFKIYEVLEEVGIDVSLKNFEKYFCFNLYSLYNIYQMPIEITLLTSKYFGFFPIWFNYLEEITFYNDLNLKLDLFFPFLELSGEDYYKINSYRLIYSFKLFYPEYTSIVTNTKIREIFFTAFFQIYPIRYIENIKTPITLETNLRFSNGTELQFTYHISLNIVSILHFKEPISPNTMIAITFISLIFITMIFILRMYRRFSLFLIKERIKNKRDFLIN